MPPAMLIPLSQTGFAPGPLLVCAAVWLFFAALWLTGLRIVRRRYARCPRLLNGGDGPAIRRDR